MTTDSSSLNFLIKVNLRETGLDVSRTLCVPSQMTFAELHEAIAAAFGWLTEPCTSWVFKMVGWNLLDRFQSHDPNKGKTTFAAFWTAPDQCYNVTPSQHNTQMPIGRLMKKGPGQCYWAYDYNVARYPHFIEVMDTQAYYASHKIMCIGGFGHISRNAWQFTSFMGLEDTVKASRGVVEFDTTAVEEKMEEVQKKFEERKRLEGEAAAAKSGERAASSEDGAK